MISQIPAEPTLVWALIVAVGALAAVVMWFAKLCLTRFTVIETKLDECESDRLELWQKLAEMGRSLNK